MSYDRTGRYHTRNRACMRYRANMANASRYLSRLVRFFEDHNVNSPGADKYVRAYHRNLSNAIGWAARTPAIGAEHPT